MHKTNELIKIAAAKIVCDEMKKEGFGLLAGLGLALGAAWLGTKLFGGGGGDGQVQTPSMQMMPQMMQMMPQMRQQVPQSNFRVFTGNPFLGR